MYNPGLDFIVGFFGCLYAGLVAVPIYPPKSNRHMNRLLSVLADAEPLLGLTHSEAEGKIQACARSHAALADLPLVVTDRVRPLSSSAWEPPRKSPGDVAMLQYTSGSTADPKGVMLTHACIMASQRSIAAAARHDENMVMASWLPIYHDMGMFGGLLQSLYAGGKTCFTSPAQFLRQPSLWLDMIGRYQATDMVGPSFGYALCSQGTDTKPVALSSIRTAWNGAEPVRADVLEAFSRKFKQHGWRHEMHFPCYGLAEATLMVTAHRMSTTPVILTLDSSALEKGRAIDKQQQAGEGEVRSLVSCGTPHDATEVIIANPDTRTACPENVVGEIWIRGPGVAAGYWKKPEDTERVFNARLQDGGGPYLRTGDLGFLRGGELYVTGRLKDLVIIRGRNIYPQDVEQRIEQVLNTVGPNCVGVFAWDDGREERLAAVIEATRSMVREAKTGSTLAQATARMREVVSEEFEVVLHTVLFLRPGDFPRTSSGKVQRGLCKERFVRGDLEAIYSEGLPGGVVHAPIPAANPVGDLAGKIEGVVLDWLTRERGWQAGRLDRQASFASLGVDSLAGAQIVLAIEARTGLCLTPEELYEYQTVDLLAGYLSRHGRPSIAGRREVIDGREVQHAPGLPRPKQDPLARYRERNERVVRWKEQGRYFFSPEISEQLNAWVTADGRRMLVLGSYGYLGLLGHDRLNDSAKEAVSLFGTGHHGTRLLAGTTHYHRRLEHRLAQLMKAEDAIVYSSGYVANVATITALVGEGDVVIGDVWNHASIIDGCRFSGAQFREFGHNDMADLSRKLSESTGKHILVVVDAVYSMEGDIAKLPEIASLCREHGAILMVDEAHSLGVLGGLGRGVQEHFQLPDDAIQIKMGTLSKALGSSGGFVAGNSDVVSYLRHHARGYIFSGALPVAEVAAADAAIEVLQSEPDRVKTLWSNRERFVAGLRRAGFNLFGSQSPIVPIATHTEEITLEMTRFCRENGLFVVPVFYPAVPMNAPRLRTCVMSSHTADDIDFAVDVLTKAKQKIFPCSTR